MPKSIKSRFNGNTEEVIEYTRMWGRFKAMEKYSIRDYKAFTDFIQKETGNANFGIHHTLGGGGNNHWAEDLLDAFLNKIIKMEAEKQHLEDEIIALRLELEYNKENKAKSIEPKIRDIMAKCLA